MVVDKLFHKYSSLLFTSILSYFIKCTFNKRTYRNLLKYDSLRHATIQMILLEHHQVFTSSRKHGPQVGPSWEKDPCFNGIISSCASCIIETSRYRKVGRQSKARRADAPQRFSRRMRNLNDKIRPRLFTGETGPSMDISSFVIQSRFAATQWRFSCREESRAACSPRSRAAQ